MCRGMVWVTGANGFIGRHLASSLSRSGYRVAGLGHGAWPDRQSIDEWLNADVLFSNLEVLRKRSERPDTIYHLAGGSSVGAAIANPAEDFRRTVTSSVELLEWVRRESSETAVVAVSSAAVYGEGHIGPITEAASLNPFSPYGYHKYMMEALCRSYGSTYGTRSVIGRLFSVFGRGLRKQLLWDLCQKLSRTQDAVLLGGTGKELRDWIDVTDAVGALQLLPVLAAADAPVVNVSTGQATSVSEIARIVVSAWRSEAAIRFSGESRSGDPFSLVGDSTKLLSLGFTHSSSASVGISDYVKWFCSVGRVDPSS